MPVDVTRVLSSFDGLEGNPYRSAPGVIALISTEEADAILEVAYLTASADREWSEEEAKSFRALVAPVTALTGAVGQTLSPGAELALFDRFEARLAHATPRERVEVLASILKSEALRALAYRVAFAMSVCDLATGGDEGTFLDALAAAFALDGRVDELSAEVYAALAGADGEAETA